MRTMSVMMWWPSHVGASNTCGGAQGLWGMGHKACQTLHMVGGSLDQPQVPEQQHASIAWQISSTRSFCTAYRGQQQ
jgi:hypothetical protein